MPTATEILREEHECILKMLDVAEAIAGAIQNGESVPAAPMARVAEFFRTFADRCHHGKEEERLFPLLEARGIPREGGPIGCMLAEHVQGRALVRRMREAADAAERLGDGAGRDGWAASASEFVPLLRAHIQKENEVLFPMADQVLTAADQSELVRAFADAEEALGRGTHERMHALLNELAASFL